VGILVAAEICTILYRWSRDIDLRGPERLVILKPSFSSDMGTSLSSSTLYHQPEMFHQAGYGVLVCDGPASYSTKPYRCVRVLASFLPTPWGPHLVFALSFVALLFQSWLSVPLEL
jgi:hypothetical protein